MNQINNESELSPIKHVNTKKNCIFKGIHQNLLESDETGSKMDDVYKLRAIKAYKEMKIFTIYGNYSTIRKALIKRGWIEKCVPGRLQKLEELSYVQLLKKAKKGNEYEIALLSKLVQSYTPNFIWQPKYFKNQYAALTPLRNRVHRAKLLDFSTKVGLIGCFDNSQWNTIKDVAETLYMPSYKLSSREDELHFRDNFRIIQCISILVYLTKHREPKEIFDEFGVVPINVIEFPIKIIENHYQSLELDDIEKIDEDDVSQWEHFSANSQLLIKRNQKIIGSEKDCLNFLSKIQRTIEKAKSFTPFLCAYGYRNLWILKPGFQCRGQGIIIMDNFYSIVNYAAKRSKLNYVVQKYIERPFLIYKTKFDIRQYMILTVFDVISIWMYKDCYLRFSSREFSLGDLREAIHITNNSIQKKYKNDVRDRRLPMCNMWSLSEFLTFLNECGTDKVWESKIYPGLKKNIISVVLSSLEGCELTPNSFEIYGCDFMLDEQLNPFLIEINSTPDMSPSTPVTARICPSALEDLLKVVLDYSKNSKTSTGKFELIYQITCTRSYNTSSDLIVSGTSKKLHIPLRMSKERKNKKIVKKTVIRKKLKSKS